MSGERRACRHLRANHQHGTHLAFSKDGCRCEPCTAAARRHAKAEDYRTQTGTHTYVPAGPARRHVEQLLATLTVGQIEQRSGVHRTCIRVLVGDFPGRPASKRITRTTEAALLAVRGDRLGPETHGLVDGIGTRRRFRALVALGWTARHLRIRLGFSSRTIWFLTSPEIDERAAVIAATRDAVIRLYDELSLTIPPPSRGRTVARGIAAARGWAPPLAWDDDTIDDPAALPAHDAEGDVLDEYAVDLVVTGARQGLTLTRAERLAALPRLVYQGLSDLAIAQRLGVSDHTVLRDRQHLGLASRWEPAA